MITNGIKTMASVLAALDDTTPTWTTTVPTTSGHYWVRWQPTIRFAGEDVVQQPRIILVEVEDCGGTPTYWHNNVNINLSPLSAATHWQRAQMPELPEVFRE